MSEVCNCFFGSWRATSAVIRSRPGDFLRGNSFT